MNINNKKIEVTCHGEKYYHLAQNGIPASAKKLDNNKNIGYFTVAESETVGNHHVVDLKEGVEFYQDGDVLYMESSVETNIRCLHADRHDSIVIPAGTYEFGDQQEYDPFTARLNKVRD